MTNAEDKVPQITSDHVLDALLGAGPGTREQAVRTIGDYLRAVGMVEFERLRINGPLWAAIEAALAAAEKAKLVTPAGDNLVQAIMVDAAKFRQSDWIVALMLAAEAGPQSAENLQRNAAEWARTYFGLTFERIRSGGPLQIGLQKALDAAIASGRLVTGEDGLLRAA